MTHSNEMVHVALDGWSALVYSRTYEVDFRLLTAPAYFSPDDEAWAMPYILTTTRHAELLSQQPRWSVFKNDRYCVVGVTFVIKRFLETVASEALELDITLDVKRRPTYAFIGYVTRHSGELLEVPVRNLKTFYQPCQYIAERWFEKCYEPQATEIVRSQPGQVATDPGQVFLPLRLNDLNQRIRLWPNEKADELWFAAVQSPFPSSLCVGFAHEKMAAVTPFLNATLPGLEQDYSIRRVEPPVSSEAGIKTPELISSVDEVEAWLEADQTSNHESEDCQTHPQVFLSLILNELQRGEKILKRLIGWEQEAEDKRTVSRKTRRSPGKTRGRTTQDQPSPYGFTEKASSDSEEDWF